MPTYIIGHRNPDPDSICSAIAYASLKAATGHPGHIPARCGNTNARIDAILERFHQPLPLHLADVTPRIRDVMTPNVLSIPPTATCGDALDMIEEHNIRVLPVLAADRHILGTISVFQLGKFFTPKVSQPLKLRRVHSTLNHILRSLKATQIHLENPDRVEEFFIRVGAMSPEAFDKISRNDGIPIPQSLVIVGDREDIQQRSITGGVRAVIISGSFTPTPATIELAHKNRVSLLVSPYDTATTALIIRTATLIDRIIDRNYTPLLQTIRLADIQRKIAASNAPAHLIVNDDGILTGILSKTDILKPTDTRLILVDHNELTQAVPGADQVPIVEIIDHHRLGAAPTDQPILFINEPLGSTCTIIANLHRIASVNPTPDIAGIMMSGIITDTLNLTSPTTTPRDIENLSWLANIAKIDSAKLAAELFNSGSIILNNTPDDVIRSDLKTYTQHDLHFAVSQVEEIGFKNLRENFVPISQALEKLRENENLYFACLLVTDINTQNSALIIKGPEALISRINYSKSPLADTYEAPGIVSRKKQLIPYLTTLLNELHATNSLS